MSSDRLGHCLDFAHFGALVGIWLKHVSEEGNDRLDFLEDGIFELLLVVLDFVQNEEL